jgi:hypothetical protein
MGTPSLAFAIIFRDDHSAIWRCRLTVSSSRPSLRSHLHLTLAD